MRVNTFLSKLYKHKMAGPLNQKDVCNVYTFLVVCTNTHRDRGEIFAGFNPFLIKQTECIKGGEFT